MRVLAYGRSLFGIALAFAASSHALTLSRKSSTVPRYPWEEAARHLYTAPRNRYDDTDSELLWASGAQHKCGSPCVAHCVVGQPRHVVTAASGRSAEENLQHYWGSAKQHAFGAFSEDPVVFSVLSISEEAGPECRHGQSAMHLDQLESALEFLNASRVLLVNDTCKTASCFRSKSRIGDCRNNETQETIVQAPKRRKNRRSMYSGDMCHDSGDIYYSCDIQVGRVKQCMDLVEEYETEHHMKFDWVMRHRPDFVWSGPAVSVSSLDSEKVHMFPWHHNRCYGAFDWFYAMPRKHAATIARFKDEITCEHAVQVPSWDALHKKPAQCVSSRLGCEGYLASWMHSQNVSFAELPEIHGGVEQRRGLREIKLSERGV